jgi:predicted acylesterase/phospholipase RssA
MAGRLVPYVRTVRAVLGPACFRDLPMSCVIQAADLTRGHRVWLSAAHHPDMPVALAVQAAAAVPGIASPVAWQGHQLADGGPEVRLPRLTIRADWIVVSSLDPARPFPGRRTGWGRRLAAAFHLGWDPGTGTRSVPVAPYRPVQGRPVTVVHAPDRLAQLGLLGVPRASRVAALIEEATAAARATLVQRIGLPDA